jgi:hypothetical protein
VEALAAIGFRRYTSEYMLNVKHKKELLRFEGKSFYLYICGPFLFIIFGVLYLIAAAKIGERIDLNLLEIIKLWIAGPKFHEHYSGALVKAISCASNAFLNFGFAILFGVFFLGVSKSRLMFREIVLILKKHNEWPDV